ncbi:unnamed protein product [Protopolystoma xenopodis]|uniref:General transcription factor TFIIB n=1 Tax=Protopolystoma xenopodis TaxID=117903 RepID=A0A448WLQ6_9PLAT|nr:unnamed protein product [Protopolystoma xenopodis]
MKCSQCGGTDFDEDRARADLTCLNCGSVLSENVVSSEIEFVETGNGVSTAVGRFVSDESQLSGYKESRQATEQKARKRIETICGPLYLGNDVVLSAFRYYQTALFRGLTRGRPVQQMAAACVYLAARMLRVNVMLLDLSDAISVNVYVLGHLYIHLKKQLNLVLPEMDPCLFIERFAHQLELGDKTSSVSNTAMRLLQRMKKDWISTGRRPSGLAAAALLVAAKIHEFNRTEEDVARIARISQQTARKRLEEFGRTPSSALSIDAFLTVDYDEEADPPAFIESVGNKHNSEAAENLNEEAMRKVSEEIKELGRRIDDEMKHLAEKRAIKNSPSSGGQSKGVHHLLDSDNTEESVDPILIAPHILPLSPLSTSTIPSNKLPSDTDPPNKDQSKEIGTVVSKKALCSRTLLREVLDGVVDPSLLETCVEDLHLLTSETGERLCHLVIATEAARNARDTAAELGLDEEEEKEVMKEWDDDAKDYLSRITGESPKSSLNNTANEAVSELLSGNVKLEEAKGRSLFLISPLSC